MPETETSASVQSGTSLRDSCDPQGDGGLAGVEGRPDAQSKNLGGRKPHDIETSLGDRCAYRFGVRVSRLERRNLERVAKENNMTLTEIFRLAVVTLINDYCEGEVDIFPGRVTHVTSMTARRPL